jgi:hypothetical protein
MDDETTMSMKLQCEEKGDDVKVIPMELMPLGNFT